MRRNSRRRRGRGGMRKVKWEGREGDVQWEWEWERSLCTVHYKFCVCELPVQLRNIHTYICTTINNANQQCPLVTTCVQCS